jgi:hypothetical protein
LGKDSDHGTASAMPAKWTIRNGFGRRGLLVTALRLKPARSTDLGGMPEGMP